MPPAHRRLHKAYEAMPVSIRPDLNVRCVRKRGQVVSRSFFATCRSAGLCALSRHPCPADGKRLIARSRNMSNPVVLITGALTGIGRATAGAFAKDGARVIASGRREAEGKALEAELRRLGAEAAFIPADVRHEDDVRNLVDQAAA